MKVVTIALVNLRRAFHDKTNLFFVVVAPFMMIFVLGMMFGGGQSLQVGIVHGSGPLTERLVKAVSEGDKLTLRRFGTEAEMRLKVERGELQAGLVLPADYDATLGSGGQATIRSLLRPADLKALDVGVWVRAVLREETALLRAARFAEAEGKGAFAANLAAAERVTVNGVDVQVTTTGRAPFPAGFNSFSVSAPPLLLMFTFLTALTTALGIIETRALGISRRMYAGPTPLRTMVGGEALGRILIALCQGLLVMFGSAVLFGVNWGDPLGAALLMVLFAIVGGGAALIVGSLFSLPGQATSAAMVLGMGLAALGGTMVPLEAFGETMRVVAHLTPHAWAVEAFTELVREGGAVLDILPQLAILAGYALVLFTLGLWLLRRALVRP
ncbi:ABC transporter permease [Nonomuraea sp. NN258]|uniref:ABC transporter permease n=1 Tax=Nonomuraea antri TaxID=2730852 RepID=UPI00156936E0|nr:ABC transporter permease [Nonomuraea antri]NRQ31686.1 ABC transporter permease [Nonomuraea antri]